MGVVDYAAFDPIFFLHHTAVDRAFAIWQALNPNSFVTPLTSEFGTYTTSPKQIEDTNTGLTPFHSNSRGTLWTSITARSTDAFGYTYPALTFWNSSGSSYQASVRAYVNSLYGPTTSAKATTRERIIRTRQHKRYTGSGPLQKREAPTDPTQSNTPSNVTTSGNQDREWLVNFRVPKNALAGSFFVHTFIGDFNSDPSQWSSDPNLAGTHCFFSNSPISSGCASCGSNLQVAGSMPLTTALSAQIQGTNSTAGSNSSLTSLDPEQVEPYLKQNLHWRVTMVSSSS